MPGVPPSEEPKEGDFIPKSEPLSEAEIAAKKIEVEKELGKLSPEEQEKISLGLTGLGFQFEKLKNKSYSFVFKSLLKPEEKKTNDVVSEEKAKELNSLLSEEEKKSRDRLNKTQEKVGFIDRKSGVGRFFSSLSDIFDRDADMAEKNLNDLREKKEKGENIFASGKGLLSMGTLAGNIIKYGRGIFDTANAVRPVMFFAMAGATFSEAAKEARATGENFSKIKDVDKAHDEALRVQMLANLTKSEEDNYIGGVDFSKKLSESEYIENVYVSEAWDEALKIQEAAKKRTNGVDKNGNPTKEALEQAYKETVPQDILNRLVKGAEGRSLVEKAFAWRLESVAKYLDKELKAVDFNEGLDKTSKEKAKEKLLNGFLRSPLIKDFDRAISHAGEIDSMFLTLSAAQDVSKVAVYAMMTDTVAKVGQQIWENVASVMGSSSEFTEEVAAKVAVSAVVSQESNVAPVADKVVKPVPVEASQHSVRVSDNSIAENTKTISSASQHDVRTSDMKISEEAKTISQASQNQVRMSDIKIAESNIPKEEDLSGWTNENSTIVDSSMTPKVDMPPQSPVTSPVNGLDLKPEVSTAPQVKVDVEYPKVDAFGAESNTKVIDTTTTVDVKSDIEVVKNIITSSEITEPFVSSTQTLVTPEIITTPPVIPTVEAFSGNISEAPVVERVVAEQAPAPVSDAVPVEVKTGIVETQQATITEPVVVSAESPVVTEIKTEIEANKNNVAESSVVEQVIAEQAPAPVVDAVPVEIKTEITETQVAPSTQPQVTEPAPTSVVTETSSVTNPEPTPSVVASTTQVETGPVLTEQELKMAHQMYDGIVKETTAGGGFLGFFNKGGEGSASWQALVKEDVNSLFSKINRDNAGIHVLSMTSNAPYSADQEKKLAKSLFEFVDKGVKPQEGEKVGDFLNRAIAEIVQGTDTTSVETKTPEVAVSAPVEQAPTSEIKVEGQVPVQPVATPETPLSANTTVQPVENIKTQEAIKVEGEVVSPVSTSAPEVVTTTENPETNEIVSGDTSEIIKAEQTVVEQAPVAAQQVQSEIAQEKSETATQVITPQAESVPEVKVEPSVESQQNTPAYIPEAVEDMKDKLRVDPSLLSPDANKIETPKPTLETIRTPINQIEVPLQTPTPTENIGQVISNKELNVLPADKLPSLTPEQLTAASKTKEDLLKIIDKKGMFSVTKGVDTPLWKALADKPVDFMLGYRDGEARARLVNLGFIDGKYLNTDADTYVRDVLKLNDSEIRMDTRLLNLNEKVRDLIGKNGIKPFAEETMSAYLDRVSKVMVLKR